LRREEFRKEDLRNESDEEEEEKLFSETVSQRAALAVGVHVAR